MVDNEATQELTQVLSRWNDGSSEAVEQLLPLVYEELRRLARNYLRKERPDHTLQATALVHEAYLRLANRLNSRWQDRVHFYAVASKIMRQILVDHARRHAAVKRGGEAVVVPIDGLQLGHDSSTQDRAGRMLALDESLGSLRELDARKAEIIELRFFGGLTIDECAEVLEVSTATVVNETRRARAWLFKEMKGSRAN